MLNTVSIFSSNPGKIFDFSGLSSAEIFNQSVLPKANSMWQDSNEELDQLDEAKKRREAQLEQDQTRTAYNEEPANLLPQPVQNPQVDVPAETNYNAPVNQEAQQPQPQSQGQESLKLSNYGYSSDSSPDYNSNVKRIGHANNPLQDGLSAALTKSLANRYNLKTGDMFEITTAEGKTMKRRYDDTVPNKYKGKALPETIDLFELNGKNSFGGQVTSLRPI